MCIEEQILFLSFDVVKCRVRENEVKCLVAPLLLPFCAAVTKPDAAYFSAAVSAVEK